MSIMLGNDFKIRPDWKEIKHYTKTGWFNSDVLIRSPYSEREKRQLICKFRKEKFDPEVNELGLLEEDLVFIQFGEEDIHLVLIVIEKETPVPDYSVSYKYQEILEMDNTQDAKVYIDNNVAELSHKYLKRSLR